jgi:hypothetical protein
MLAWLRALIRFYFCLPEPAPLSYRWHAEPPPPALPEPDFDPVAFWLFPDWDGGPIKEPFWMRPLKEPPPPPADPMREALKNMEQKRGEELKLYWGNVHTYGGIEWMPAEPEPIEWEGARLESFEDHGRERLVVIVEADGDHRKMPYREFILEENGEIATRLVNKGR